MEYEMSDLIRLAQSPAGKQLIAYLQANGGTQLQSIVRQATAGNMEGAKGQLSSLLDSEEAKNLLRQLEAQK